VFSGPDWLANFFLFIFLFGLIFTIMSLLLGFAHGIGAHTPHVGGHHVHIDVAGHHAHVDVGGHHAHVDIDGAEGPGLFNMPSMMAFLTWFGGMGYIFRASWGLSGYIAVPLALASGAVGAGIMFVLLARVLWPMMSKPLRTADFQLPGTPARVVSPIRAGGVGEIIYVKGGVRFTAGARSEDGEPIARGTEVVILRYERGLAYVKDVNSILSTDTGKVQEAEEETKVS
jgi:hypothetical protein